MPARPRGGPGHPGKLARRFTGARARDPEVAPIC